MSRSSVRDSVSERAPLSIPRCPRNLSYTERAEQGLGQEDRRLLSLYLDRIGSMDLRRFPVVSSLQVDISVDPDEGDRRITVTHSIDSDAKTAFAYWDYVGDDMDQWAAGLHGETAEKVLRLISTNVRWKE